MEACLHFRGAALNASEAGISRDWRNDLPLPTTVAKALALPCGVGGIDGLSLLAFLIRKDESLQTAFPFHILAEGGDIIEGRIVDIMLEPAEA